MGYVDLDGIARPANAGTLLTQWGDQVDDNFKFFKGDAAWTTPAFANGWVSFGGGYSAAGFRLIGDEVVCRGVISTGTLNTTAFTFPVGYRPTASEYFGVASNGALGVVTVTSAGVLTPVSGSNVSLSLVQIRFSTI